MRFSACLVGLAGVLAGTGTAAPESLPCTSAPVFDNGRSGPSECAERIRGARTVIDLGDGWAPAIFSETADRPQSCRATFVALANERLGDTREWDSARRVLDA
jgi:hypothetical protein